MSEAREGRSLNHALTLTRIALALLRAIHPFPQITLASTTPA